MGRRRGRRAWAELRSLFPQTACQDTDEEEEEEDQVRAQDANWEQAVQVVSPGQGGQGTCARLEEPGLLKGWEGLRMLQPCSC